jgi:hypothetical protein
VKDSGLRVVVLELELERGEVMSGVGDVW